MKHLTLDHILEHVESSIDKVLDSLTPSSKIENWEIKEKRFINYKKYKTL